jgi:hypothetical protein
MVLRWSWGPPILWSYGLEMVLGTSDPMVLSTRDGLGDPIPMVGY